VEGGGGGRVCFGEASFTAPRGPPKKRKRKRKSQAAAASTRFLISRGGRVASAFFALCLRQRGRGSLALGASSKTKKWGGGVCGSPNNGRPSSQRGCLSPACPAHGGSPACLSPRVVAQAAYREPCLPAPLTAAFQRAAGRGRHRSPSSWAPSHQPPPPPSLAPRPFSRNVTLSSPAPIPLHLPSCAAPRPPRHPELLTYFRHDATFATPLPLFDDAWRVAPSARLLCV
jgi:hypothetical protein